MSVNRKLFLKKQDLSSLFSIKKEVITILKVSSLEQLIF